jgi:hypothetical protein
MRILIIVLCLLLSACATHHCCRGPMRICNVESHWGTPNQIISKPAYTWYGYVTKTCYPVKNNFSTLAPRTPIAIPVPLTHGTPDSSSSDCVCSLWFKANNYGTVLEIKREGKYCNVNDWSKPVGN